jgi:uncharacterized protein YhjY with autotransporter beta-barrel domain
LPAGLSLNSATGAITGTPTGSGASGFTIQALDSAGNVGSRAYSINIGTSSLTLNPPSLPAATQGTPYSQGITASGGTGPYNYSITAGSLPAGLSFNTGTGAITGTPTGSGPSTFTVQALDANGNTGSRSYTINVGTNSLTLNPASLPAATQATAYNQNVSASGGSAPYTYAVTAGALPVGLSLNGGTGTITGTPTGSGPSSFTIQARDANGNTGSRSYTINVGTSSLSINPASLPNGSQGVAYNQTVSASGGTAPYAYSIASGALPPGLSLNAATGAVTGTPTTSGISTFTVFGRDINGNTGTKSYTINIGNNSLTLTPAALPNATQGRAYSQTLTANGGTGPYTFSILSGALPAGLSLDPASGAVTGTPTGSGLANFTIGVTDINGNTGSQAYAVNVGTNSLTINPATLPPAPQGSPYNQIVSATGGTAPYVFSILSGTLPPGLTLNSNTGAITGTPTTIGVFSFTIQALDPNGNFGTRTFTLSTARLDPTKDPNVQALVVSQAATTRRFANAQTGNVMRHLEGLHGNFNPCGLTNEMGISVYEPRTDTILIERSDGTLAPTVIPAGPRVPPPARDCPQRWWLPAFAYWSGGSMEFGSPANNGFATTNRFSTAGLTAGIDARLTELLIIGAAIGYGNDRTTFGDNGTRSDGRVWSGMLYASAKPIPGWFVDGVVGYGKTGFDNQRWVAIDGSILNGTRSGATWFASLSLGPEFRFAALTIAPYLRGDFLSAHLDSYGESGASIQALTFGAVNFSSTAAMVGLRGSYDFATDWGVISPMARLELRHALDGGFSQPMWYSDLGSAMTYSLAQADTTRNLLTTSLGLRARFISGTSVEFEYGATTTGVSSPIQTVRGALRMPF